MSKPQAAKPAPIVNSFSVSRKDSGYFVTKHTLQDGKVISSEKVSEPDVLVICISTLEKLIRKDQGL